MSETNYNVTTQLSEGVWVFKDGDTSWGQKCNSNFEKLNESLKAKTLTLSVGGTTVDTFSTNTTKTVDLPVASDTQIDNLI